MTGSEGILFTLESLLRRHKWQLLLFVRVVVCPERYRGDLPWGAATPQRMKADNRADACARKPHRRAEHWSHRPKSLTKMAPFDERISVSAPSPRPSGERIKGEGGRLPPYNALLLATVSGLLDEDRQEFAAEQEPLTLDPLPA